jgi:hypothetical protein
MEKKAILMIDERYNFLVNELNKESKNRNESLENFNKIIETDIPKIQENLKEEQNEMIENDNAISNKINEETQRLISLVMNEKKAREETEEALLEMLKAMINAMKTQLENERRERFYISKLDKILKIILSIFWKICVERLLRLMILFKNFINLFLYYIFYIQIYCL